MSNPDIAFSPVQLGSFSLSSRFAMAPMTRARAPSEPPPMRMVAARKIVPASCWR